jgi:hypothetical protein
VTGLGVKDSSRRNDVDGANKGVKFRESNKNSLYQF